MYSKYAGTDIELGDDKHVLLKVRCGTAAGGRRMPAAAAALHAARCAPCASPCFSCTQCITAAR